MKLRNIKILFVSLLFGVSSSCDYLDVSDELAGGINDYDLVFDNADYTRKWYGQVFDNVPDYSRMWSDAGMGNIWAYYADELYSRISNNTGKYVDWNAANTSSQRWNTLYESIRQANMFLERAKPIDGGGSNADRITELELSEYKANVRFMRALYYFYLMELYGPVPIVSESKTLEDVLDLPRQSLDKVIDFIDKELEIAMPDLRQEPQHDATTGTDYRALPTKGVALALRAKLWTYAASPLFNGGFLTLFPQAAAMTDGDGDPLYPAADSGQKWAKAVLYNKAFIDYAEEGGRYELYKNTGTFSAEKSVYEVFQEYNKEIIWATAKTQWGKLGDQNFDTMTTPRSEPKGLGGIHVLQELVDDFYMSDGLPIKETPFLPKSTSYEEAGFSTYEGFEVSNMYIGREPRFYSTVTFSGKKWHISNKEVQFYKGGNADNSVADGKPETGYLLYKRMNRTVHGNSPGVASKFRPSIIFRLADFYLLYAEALNETDPNNPDVLKYVNLVRERAGIEKLEILNPAIVGKQDLQREAIQRERRIELATEGQRYFDVRRWMIAGNTPGEGGQGGDFTGMSPNGNKVTFHIRRKYHTRVFKPKNYFYPIPLSEIQKSKNILLQTPGW